MTYPSPDGTEDRPAGHAAPDGAIDSALARITAVDPAKFAEAYWGRQPLVTRADELAGADGFRDLLSPEAVDELLSERGLRTPFLRVADQGKVLPAASFTGSGGAGAEIGDQVTDDKVLRLYAGGATLVLQGLHRLWPPLVRFAGRLGDELCQPLQVNAYLTPAGNRGFATHYDTHDVFVLQVDGTKRWRIHEPVLPDPLERQAWGGRADEVGAVAEGPAALDVVLAPGDALYLPRGWLHSAEAQGERSLHLTFGVRALTRFAFVEELLALAAEDSRLRATLPYGMDVADPSAVAPELTDTVSALREWLLTADPIRIADRLRARAWPAQRPAPVRPLAQLAFAERLAPADQVKIRAGLRWRLHDDGSDQVVLTLADRTLRLPAYCAPALHFVLDGDIHHVADLPGLDDDADRLVLVRRLLREAVLVPA
ncbi:cupin domain-containing protein [Actinoplanes sp. NPDC051859]|uniref:cupin domain-containing protein n=1 Tax=Actinoplanes sp. NPDC051859 TaxID=3363909 RepID=UPI00378B5C17